MPFYYQVRLALNFGALGVLQNTYSISYGGSIQLTNSAILSLMTTWMNSIYNTSGLRNTYANEITLKECEVTEHTVAGVLVRTVGNISPTVAGNSSADSSALTTAMSAQMNTNTPNVRGAKRFPPPTDDLVVNGLLVNSCVATLAQAAANWISPGLVSTNPWVAGVFSTSTGQFVFTNGTGTVRNIPGTQTTRKPGRGL